MRHSHLDNGDQGQKTRILVEIPAIIALVSLAVLFVFRRFVILDDPRDLMGCGDHWLYFGPNAFFLDRSLHYGTLPLWNPLVECGKPFAANPQSLLFYPPFLLRALLTPDPTPFKSHITVALMVAGHLILAGTATYVFARRHGLSIAASLCAALLVLFNANTVGYAFVHWIFVAIAAWLPVILIFIHTALTTDSPPRRIAYSIWAAWAFALGILCGFPQLMLYVAFGVAAYATGFALLFNPSLEKPSRPLVRLGRSVLVLTIAGVVAIAATMVMLLPATELAASSARAKDISILYDREQEFSYSLLDVIEFLTVYPGAKHLMSLRAAGTLCVVLGVMGLLFGPRRRTLLFAATSYILIDCSLGRRLPFGMLAAWLAPFEFHHPERATAIAVFFLAILAGFGVDGLAAALRQKPRTARLAVAIAAAVAAACIFRWVHLHRYLDVPAWLAVAPALCLLIYLFPLPKKFPSAYVRSAACALVCIEVLIWSGPFSREVLGRWPYREPTGLLFAKPEFSTVNRRGTAPTAPEMKQLLYEKDFGFGESWNNRMYALEPVINGYEPLYLRSVRQVLCAPEQEPYYTRDIHQWEVSRKNHRGFLFLKRRFWLARQYVEGPLPEKDTLFPPTTTVFLPEPPDAVPAPRVERADVVNRGVSDAAVCEPLMTELELPALLTPEQGKDNTVWKALGLVQGKPAHRVLTVIASSTGAVELWIDFRVSGTGRLELGRQYTVPVTHGSKTVLSFPLPDYETIEAVLRVEFLDASGKFQIHRIDVWTDLADEDEHLTIREQGPNSVELAVHDLSEPRILLCVDAMYPGWKAYLNGEPIPIFRANDAFKAVVVPTGTHTVRFVFRPWKVYLGAVITLTAFGVSLVAVFVLSRSAALRTHRV